MSKPPTFHAWIEHRIITAQTFPKFVLMLLILSPFLFISILDKAIETARAISKKKRRSTDS